MRLPLLSPSELSPEQRPLYDDMRKGIETNFKGFVAINEAGQLIGPWNPWIRFFCQAISAQCASLITGAQLLLHWLAESRRKGDERRWTGAIHKVVAGLIEWPVTTISDTRLAIRGQSDERDADDQSPGGGRHPHRAHREKLRPSFGARDVMNIVEKI